MAWELQFANPVSPEVSVRKPCREKPSLSHRSFPVSAEVAVVEAEVETEVEAVDDAVELSLVVRVVLALDVWVVLGLVTSHRSAPASTELTMAVTALAVS